MKKKLLSALLSTAMVAMCLTGCGNKQETTTTTDTSATDTTTTDTTTTTTTDTTDTTDTTTIEAAEIPQDYVYYYSFDQADDSDAIAPAAQDTAAGTVTVTDKEKIYIPGVKGEAIYTDGVTGIKLTDVNGVGDNYTVSYWIYATRFANYMPTVQFGPDVHGDVTGGQHYLNITRAEWGTDSAATFPCVWAYDQLDNALWPNWAPDTADEHLKEWMNVTITVDSADVSTDGTMLEAHLYLNGEELTKTDSDGNLVPINVVNGCMEASDNFDFLLGVNYWDSVFKGAFDELYIYDYALDASQVKGLYEAGDTTVAYEEPEHVAEVVDNSANAISVLGTTDLTAGWWSDWTQSFEIKDGETKEVSLRNFSDGVNAWDNFVTVFTNEPNEDGVDPNSVASDTHKEWAVTRADLYTWGSNVDNDNGCTYNYSWGNWDTWRTKVMTDATVTMKINRSGNTLTIDYSFVDYLGSENTAQAVITTELTAEDPCYFLFTNEASYVELYSVKDAVVVTASDSYEDAIGTTTYGLSFWGDWTECWELADGATKTFTCKNYSDGANNWDNFVAAFVNVPTNAHEAPATASDTYAEYAVVRADAYGWGDASYAGTFTTSWDDWAAWEKMMMASDVTITVSRNGGEITIDETFTDQMTGDVYTENAVITSTLTAADPCYMFFTGEACYFEVLSVE